MSSSPTKRDQRIREAAFDYVRKLVMKRGFVTKEQLWKKGGVFKCEGERLSLIHPQWGGYKPKQMSHLLSLLSTHGGSIKYNVDVPEPPIQGDVDCIFYYLIKGQSPDYSRNRYLHDAWKHGVPILFFLETDRQCFVPTLAQIQSWEPEEHRVLLAFSSLDSSIENLGDAANDLNRRYDSNHRYIVARHKQRLRQQEFRSDLFDAYASQCAISGLSESKLLEAAHIIPDHQGGPPDVSNGLLLSKIHHAAFDHDLIGITPDYHVKVSKRLKKDSSDFLALWKKIDGKPIRFPPRRKAYWLAKKFLEKRYKEFQAADKK